MKLLFSLAFVICIGFGTVSSTRAQTVAQGLQGVWQVVEVTDSSGTNSKPEPGLYIFTRRHYSIVEIQSRPEVAEAPMDVRSQSGGYETANGLITFSAIVARNPAAMQKAIQGSYTLANGMLTITTGKVVRKFRRLE